MNAVVKIIHRFIFTVKFCIIYVKMRNRLDSDDAIPFTPPLLPQLFASLEFLDERTATGFEHF